MLIVSETLYLLKTEGDTNVCECHPCFMIPLLMTKAPSTSCLVVITKGIEDRINVASLSLSLCERFEDVGLCVLNLIMPIYSTWFP